MQLVQDQKAFKCHNQDLNPGLLILDLINSKATVSAKGYDLHYYGRCYRNYSAYMGEEKKRRTD